MEIEFMTPHCAVELNKTIVTIRIKLKFFFYAVQDKRYRQVIEDNF